MRPPFHEKKTKKLFAQNFEVNLRVFRSWSFTSLGEIKSLVLAELDTREIMEKFKLKLFFLMKWMTHMRSRGRICVTKNVSEKCFNFKTYSKGIPLGYFRGNFTIYSKISCFFKGSTLWIFLKIYPKTIFKMSKNIQREYLRTFSRKFHNLRENILNISENIC